MSISFNQVLDQIRHLSDSEANKGRLFERVMKSYFEIDSIYQYRFSEVMLYSEWASKRSGFNGQDTGIDLVAREREGDGWCAIQTKCYAPGTRISKAHVDSFISASNRPEFIRRIIVDTGEEWGPTASETASRASPRCQVIGSSELLSRPFEWPDLLNEKNLHLKRLDQPYKLRPHQQLALDQVITGFESYDRGKLIMACGTGKTFTALRIAEKLTGIGSRVLYLVPSISLLQQSMREWSDHQAIPHRYVGICSDTGAGRNSEDIPVQELEFPVTTDSNSILHALKSKNTDAITVFFCTYQSAERIADAQSNGGGEFDLVICDEAHRTTGIERNISKSNPSSISHFQIVHDDQQIRAKRRLYMTATPRLYTEGAKSKAKINDIGVYSMDDETVYGPEFHRLAFSEAVSQQLLSDYKVVVLALSEKEYAPNLQNTLSQNKEINISDTAKIVGCWRALSDPENTVKMGGEATPCKRAIAFSSTIRASKRLEHYWEEIVEDAIARLDSTKQDSATRCQLKHVDGKNNAIVRKSCIEWLKKSDPSACRILTNARCLSEGIDVPALDAVMFMSTRSSVVDIVQAVGRVMRKTEGKKYGYIILPVTVPADIPADVALNSNKRFQVVWDVLRALRSHDDRLDAEINQITLNQTPPERIIIMDAGGGDVGDESHDERQQLIPFPPLDVPPGAIFARIAERCGDRRYWENWAEDVADIFARLVSRIRSLLDNRANKALREWFEAFLEELQTTLNSTLTEDDAIEMMAQHILTRPVFEALFENYDFVASNPVSRELDALHRDFKEFNLEAEVRDIDSFYESIRNRVKGIDNANARQEVLKELYETFFKKAVKRQAERLGIVYTPNEIVDFILKSSDEVMRSELGRGLTDKEVHILDPFTGTGTFLVRLIQSGLINDVDLGHKFHNELHANEVVLLAYYIAAVHVEEAWHNRNKITSRYEPFPGIVLTDTFNLHTGRTDFPKQWMPDNSERAKRQQEAPIRVIIGNPPWSAGQRSSSDNNPNPDYPELEGRISETYAKRSKATLKNSLYDTYKMAIRWATDRIGKQGIIAMVTNGSWIDGNADRGLRACLYEEFSKIHVINLRGNARLQGEQRRSEGGNVFGLGSRTTAAILILVRNPKQSGCTIHYHDIGDYLDRKAKLQKISSAASIRGISDWENIIPDSNHDWIRQQNARWPSLLALFSKNVKAGRSAFEPAIFKLYSNGYKTGRDNNLYNFSAEECAENARRAIQDYVAAMAINKHSKNKISDLKQLPAHCSANIQWDAKLLNNMLRCKKTSFDKKRIWRTVYRPFVRQFCYVDYLLVQRKSLMDKFFPEADTCNRVILVSGIGSSNSFSTLMVDGMPDLGLISGGQCLARYSYQSTDETQSGLLAKSESSCQRVDNITNESLEMFRSHYKNNKITKDDIFDYVYGVLHASDYRKVFANDLVKDFTRIPLAPVFDDFAKAGRKLGQLHLNYEKCPEYPLKLLVDGKEGIPTTEQIKLTTRKMRFKNKSDPHTLIINDHICIAGIPPEAHQYEVNGKTPLGWFIDRYHVKKDGGITNDPNKWFSDAHELIKAIYRIVYLSIETTRVIDSLPKSIK